MKTFSTLLTRRPAREHHVLHVSILCTLVHRRRNARCPLGTLFIPTASISREDMAELKQLIDVEDFQDEFPMLIEEMIREDIYV